MGRPGNHMFLPTSVTDRRPATLTLNSYKTAKIYQQVTEELPPLLVTEIRASLARNPREYLFVSTRDRLPYHSEKAFSQWANSLLERTFGKKLNLTLLRHAAITALDFNKLTPLERQDIAHRMGHSVETQGKYKFIFREKDA